PDRTGGAQDGDRDHGGIMSRPAVRLAAGSGGARPGRAAEGRTWYAAGPGPSGLRAGDAVPERSRGPVVASGHDQEGKMLVSEWMTPDPRTVSPDTPVMEAMQY